MHGKCNYAVMLSAGLFSLDAYEVRNVWTQLISWICVL